MSEFPELQQESAAACENMDIGPFRKGPKLKTTILFFAYLQNLGLEALKFKGSYLRTLFRKGPRTLQTWGVIIWEGPSS